MRRTSHRIRGRAAEEGSCRTHRARRRERSDASRPSLLSITPRSITASVLIKRTSTSRLLRQTRMRGQTKIEDSLSRFVRTQFAGQNLLPQTTRQTSQASTASMTQIPSLSSCKHTAFPRREGTSRASKTFLPSLLAPSLTLRSSTSIHRIRTARTTGTNSRILNHSPST